MGSPIHALKPLKHTLGLSSDSTCSTTVLGPFEVCLFVFFFARPGLPLSRLYARYLGGALDLVSLPGYGTHAYVNLPRVQSQQVEVVPDARRRVSRNCSWKKWKVALLEIDRFTVTSASFPMFTGVFFQHLGGLFEVLVRTSLWSHRLSLVSRVSLAYRRTRTTATTTRAF